MSSDADDRDPGAGASDLSRLDALTSGRNGVHRPAPVANEMTAGARAGGPAETRPPVAEQHGPTPGPAADGADDLFLEDISLVIGEKHILQPMSLRFARGMVTALSGPSGSGKTTVLSIAGGLLRPTRGSARLGELPMWQGDGDPRHEVAFVLQVYGLVPILSARENVAIALRARGIRPAEADARADLELTRFHIGDLGDRQVEELSGGQMQRVACARCFAVEPQVLLADEPTSELDEGNREHVMMQLAAEAARGAVVVVATHDPAVVDAAEQHFVLDDGFLTDHVAAVGELHPGFHG